MPTPTDDTTFDQELRDAVRPMVGTRITEETLDHTRAIGAVSKSRTSLSSVEFIATVVIVIGVVGVVRFMGVSTTGGRSADGIVVGDSLVSVTRAAALVTVSASTKGAPARVLAQARFDTQFGVRQLVCGPESAMGQHVILFGTSRGPVSVDKLGAGAPLQLEDGTFLFVGEGTLVPGQPWSVMTPGEAAISGNAATMGERLPLHPLEPSPSGTTPCVVYDPATEILK